MDRILLVDDDAEVLQINGEYLKKKGFEVLLAESVKDACLVLKKKAVQCVVMDVMMPDVDGFDGFRQIRSFTDAPVLFLTAKTQEQDRIRGLSLGADDYIVKPCSLEELSLRIQINIRRRHKEEKRSEILEFPPLRIDLLQQKAYYDMTEILLSQREFQLLLLFAQHPGELLTFEQIGMKLFGHYMEADRKNIMVSTSRLRKKMESYVGLEHMIETTWGKGYRFVGERS